AGDLHAAPVADDAAIADPLVLAAVALPVLGRTEDLLAEEPLALGLERAVVDGLRILDLAAGPRPDLLGGSKSDAYSIEVVYVQARHAPAPLPVLVFVVVPEERQRVVQAVVLRVRRSGGPFLQVKVARQGVLLLFQVEPKEVLVGLLLADLGRLVGGAARPALAVAKLLVVALEVDAELARHLADVLFLLA